MDALPKVFGIIGLLISFAAQSAPGALIGQTGQAGPPNNSTSLPQYQETRIPFNTVSYDDYGFFNPAQPSRLTIPAGFGITRAKLTFTTETSFSVNPYNALITVKKNGQYTSGIPGTGRQASPPSYNPQVMATTAWIPVNAGDYFELFVYVNGISFGSPVHTSDYTSLAIEVQ